MLEFDNLMQGFLDHEITEDLILKEGKLIIAAIGTVANQVLQNSSLHDNLRDAHLGVERFQSFSDDTTLLRSTDWTIALVLSPYKRAVIDHCSKVAPTAQSTRVVDTLLHSKGGIIGINTNAYAAAEAVKQLTNGNPLRRVLVAGTGASCRSVIVGLKNTFPQAEIGVMGRSIGKAKAVIQDLKIGEVVNNPESFSADLVINATTVGQTPDLEDENFALRKTFAPQIRFLDLNNRVSALQTEALEKGCIVMSGVTMQIITNKLRIALLTKLTT